ncbi:hypothetical protein [Fuerstiella marisgermanici]|uniref:Uncharacterized protein n=1 Tax=Fuerstiella marisgermanici TaxID=1891926 RepID=A0A1P8WSE0_9PLAN|nr:hypothetical protein [Fuerstiella marisgermanici]APZ96987.1 hypothetical protein Fuma_06663 [Fuerstiella marisgermanici]
MIETPQNPYESPTVFGIFILSLIAACGTFFVTCVGSLFVVGPILQAIGVFGDGNTAALQITFIACAIAAIVAAVRVFRWRYREETVSDTAFKAAARSRQRNNQ